jgi:hypothetical protein
MNKKIIRMSLFLVVLLSVFNIGFSATYYGGPGGPGGPGGSIYGSLGVPTTETPIEITDLSCNNRYVDQVVSGSNSFLKMSVVSPFGDVLTSETKRFKACRNCDQTEVAIQLDYSGFSYDFSCSSDKEIYCTVGGLYKTITEVSVFTPNGENSKLARELYYCKTTTDVYNSVKIPQSWEEDKLLVYCNDGGSAGYSEIGNINFEYLSKEVNAYKVCIIKNQDLSLSDEINTNVVYGLEYGLPDVRSTNKFKIPKVRAEIGTYFNVTTMEGNLVQGLSGGVKVGSNGGFDKFEFVDSFGREYILEYNEQSYEFMIYDKGLVLDGSLLNYYGLNDVNPLTRSILIRNKGDGDKVVGYDFAGSEKDLETRLPIYYINNYNFNQQDTCVKHLGRYGAIIPTTAVTSTSTVGCLNTGEIEINSKGFTTSKIEPFNIYKNIVFGYE